MGASESTAAAAAAGGAVQERIKKEKKRAKRFCCCCTWCTIAAIVFVVVGIILIVYFVGKDTDVGKGVTYTGIAFICLGVLLLIIGVICGVALYVVYRKLNGKSSTKAFVAPKYAPGTAPYPQQDWGGVPDPHNPDASPVIPQQPGQAAVDTEMIKPELH